MNAPRSFPFKMAAAVLISVAGLYLAFELGRLQAGYSMFDERRRIDALQAELVQKNVSIDELQREIARLETSSEIDSETYSEVKANLAQLQASIQAQEEELVFYRGIVSPGDGVAGLRIQNVEVQRQADGPHLLRILLVQAIVHNDRVTGSVRANLKGYRDGEEVILGLDEIAIESQGADIPYGFRYFQTLELGIAWPEDFEPEELEIQVWPREPRGETMVQAFSWAAVSG